MEPSREAGIGVQPQVVRLRTQMHLHCEFWWLVIRSVPDSPKVTHLAYPGGAILLPSVVPQLSIGVGP